MGAVNSVPKVRFRTAAASPRFDSTIAKRCVVLGVAEAGDTPILTPKVVGSGANARALFGESAMTRIAETHFAQDPQRTTFTLMRLTQATAGVLAITTSGPAGTSVPSVAVTPTPLGKYAPRFEVLTGGTVGTSGIVIRKSAGAAGSNPQDVALGTATFIGFPELGIRVDLTVGTLLAGYVISGYTIPPRWDGAGLTAGFNKLISQKLFFQLLGIAEPIDLAVDVPLLTAGLTGLTASGRDVHVLSTWRPRWSHTVTSTITATVANDNPDTVTRAAGSWITDGAKVGMYMDASGFVNSANNAPVGPITGVTALTLTFATSVALTAEAATPSVIVALSESEDNYITNAETAASVISQPALTVLADEIRVTSPGVPGLILDKPFIGEVISRVVIDPVDVDLGQVRQDGASGGALASGLNGRIYEGIDRIHYDADADDRLQEARYTTLRSWPDELYTGAYVTRGLTMYGPTDAIQTIVQARLANLWRAIVRQQLIAFILLGQFADESDPNRISEAGAQNIEGDVLRELRRNLANMVSNLNSIGLDSLFAVDRDSDLSIGIQCTGKIITKIYPDGFDVTLTVAVPGQV